MLALPVRETVVEETNMIMEKKRLVEKDPKLKKDDLIVIGGGGGFIGGALARYFRKKGFTRIRAADKKPLPEWYQRVPGVECLNLDLSVAGQLQAPLRRGGRGL